MTHATASHMSAARSRDVARRRGISLLASDDRRVTTDVSRYDTQTHRPDLAPPSARHWSCHAVPASGLWAPALGSPHRDARDQARESWSHRTQDGDSSVKSQLSNVACSDGDGSRLRHHEDIRTTSLPTCFALWKRDANAAGRSSPPLTTVMSGLSSPASIMRLSSTAAASLSAAA